MSSPYAIDSNEVHFAMLVAGRTGQECSSLLGRVLALCIARGCAIGASHVLDAHMYRPLPYYGPRQTMVIKLKFIYEENLLLTQNNCCKAASVLNREGVCTSNKSLELCFKPFAVEELR
jgi:hypothetical protein